jgi:hypothetical protein
VRHVFQGCLREKKRHILAKLGNQPNRSRFDPVAGFRDPQHDIEFLNIGNAATAGKHEAMRPQCHQPLDRALTGLIAGSANAKQC